MRGRAWIVAAVLGAAVFSVAATAAADTFELGLEPGIGVDWALEGTAETGSPGRQSLGASLALSLGWFGDSPSGTFVRLAVLGDSEGDVADMVVGDIAYAYRLALPGEPDRRLSWSHAVPSVGLSVGYASKMEPDDVTRVLAGVVLGMDFTVQRRALLFGVGPQYRMLFQPGPHAFDTHHVFALRLRIAAAFDGEQRRERVAARASRRPS